MREERGEDVDIIYDDHSRSASYHESDLHAKCSEQDHVLGRNSQSLRWSPHLRFEQLTVGIWMKIELTRRKLSFAIRYLTVLPPTEP